jgi:hypothetical protein
MFRVCARNYHRCTHLILALGIVREPVVWGFYVVSQAAVVRDSPERGQSYLFSKCSLFIAEYLRVRNCLG